VKTKDDYIDNLATELKVWSAKIDLLSARAETAVADMKQNYQEEIAALRAKQNAGTEKIKELQGASGDAWEVAKQTADTLWDELKAGVENAASKFK
jgi:hypothetical protein